MKIHRVGADLFHVDRKKKDDMTNLTVASGDFTKHINISTFMGYPTHVPELKRATISSYNITIKKANTFNSASESVSDVRSIQTILNNDAGNKTAITLRCIFQP
jgi:hypothetical protein